MFLSLAWTSTREVRILALIPLFRKFYIGSGTIVANYNPHLGKDLGGEDLGVGSFVPQVLHWIRSRSSGSGPLVANYNPHLGIDLGTGGENLGVGSLVPRINLHGVGEYSRRLLQVIELGRPSQIIRE
jgi:hypothetical protein